MTTPKPHVIGANITTGPGTLLHASLDTPRASRFDPTKPAQFFMQQAFSRSELDLPSGKLFMTAMDQEGQAHHRGKSYKDPRRSDVEGKLCPPGTAMFLKAATGANYKPQLFYRNENGQIIELKENDGRFYPGARVHSTFTCFPYNYVGRLGISCSLVSVLWIGDGPRLRAASDGSEYGDLGSEVDPYS